MGAVASLLADHVSFRVSSVDRIGLAGYIPGLAYEGGVLRFLISRGYPIPAPAGLAHNHKCLVAEFNHLVEDNDIPVLRFPRRAKKEDLARPYQDRARAEGRTGIVLVGKAQERLDAWVGYTHNPNASHPHYSYSRQSKVPDHWYFYLFDDDWGPVLVRLCPFAPYPVWVNANGHEWVKRQLDKAGVAYEAMDNGLLAVEDPKTAHRLAARLSAGHLLAGLHRWLSWIPSPLTAADHRHGFRYDFSIRQIEISDTAVFDRPASGRAFFDSAIRDHLDLGRPDKVSLVFDRRICNRKRRPTPGRFQTKVVTQGVDPQIQIHYKSSKVKAYFKHGHALRVETTINDPSNFDVGRRLVPANWQSLRQIGEETNARFLAAIGEGEPERPDPATLQAVVMPSETDGLRAPGLRFGDSRVMALFAGMASFSNLVGGLTNAGLRSAIASLLDRPYTQAQASYDLARLKRKGLIERVPGRNRYRVTPQGRAIACLFTRIATRVFLPALADLESLVSPPPQSCRPLTLAWRSYERELDVMITTAMAA